MKTSNSQTTCDLIGCTGVANFAKKNQQEYSEENCLRYQVLVEESQGTREECRYHRDVTYQTEQRDWSLEWKEKVDDLISRLLNAG